MSAPKKASKRLGELFSLVKAVLLGRPNISLDNRRQSPRLRLRVPVLCKHGDEELPGELLDISNTGMRVTVKSPVEVDETLRVSAPDQSGLVGRQRLICRVAWVKVRRPEYELGLEYNDSDENVAHSWIQLALRHLDPEQVKRRSRRIPANLFVQVSDSHGYPLGRGICVNISTGGCLLQMERHIPKDDVVKMGLGPSDQEASIFLTGRIVSHVHSAEHGQFLHHLQFFPGENRNHSRLRSLMLTLLEELQMEGREQTDEADLELEDEEEGSLFRRLSQPAVPAPVARQPRSSVPAQEPSYSPPKPAKPAKPLSELLGQPAPIQPRSYEVRTKSIWAARNLPVRSHPKDQRKLVQEPEAQPGDERDFLS